MTQPLHSRLLTDLAPPDIQEYLASGKDTIIIPLGSVEMHGYPVSYTHLTLPTILLV